VADSGADHALRRPKAACAWRPSAKLRKNLHQIVDPAIAVQVL
jgi:hypothetical protein